MTITQLITNARGGSASRLSPFRFLSRCGVALLCALFFSQNCLLLHAAETGFWAERRRNIDQRTDGASAETQLARLPQGLPPIAPRFHTPAFPTPAAVDAAATPLSADAISDFADFPRLTRKAREVAARVAPRFGSIREIAVSEDKTPRPVVLHIQDIHLHAEAQTQIAGAVRSLLSADAVDAIALEAGFGPMDFGRLFRFPIPEAVDRMADGLLRYGEMPKSVNFH